mgnify:FL=1
MKKDFILPLLYTIFAFISFSAAAIPLFYRYNEKIVEKEIESRISLIDERMEIYYNQIITLYPQLKSSNEFPGLYESYMHNGATEEELQKFITETIIDKDSNPLVQRLVQYNRDLLLLMMKAHKNYIMIEFEKLNEVKQDFNDNFYVKILNKELM